MTFKFIKRREAGLYVVAFILALAAFAAVMKLWQADLRVPFDYRGDALLHALMVKGIHDNGWYLTNDRLGMPDGFDFRDFPTPDNFHWLWIRVFFLFTSNFGLALNLFYILTYPLTTVTTLFVLRRLGVSPVAAVGFSLLYAFLPYHFLRGVSHLLLSAYYMVPLIVLILLWVCDGEKILWRSADTGWRGVKPSVRHKKGLYCLLVCLLIGSTGAVYYAFFSSFLLLIAGLIGYLRARDSRQWLTPLVLVAVIFGTVLINVSPSLLYARTHGKLQITDRKPEQAEVWGLKIAQMLLPVEDHRWRPFAGVQRAYRVNRPLVNENIGAALGVIGSLGFLLLLSRLFKLPRAENNSETERLLQNLSRLNLAAVLLGTIGGFGALFALFVSPQIRSYNRISIFIAFFAFAALALQLERWRVTGVGRKIPAAVFSSGIILLTLFGLGDQTTPRNRPDYERLTAEFRSDAGFVEAIEAQMPLDAMIFQLPIVQFPDAVVRQRMEAYELLKGYLHSQRLRWSYPAMKGQTSDFWQQQLALQPTPVALEAIARAGFKGLYIDRFAYPDSAVKLESEITQTIGSQPALISADRRLSFFDLQNYAAKLESSPQAAEQPRFVNQLGVAWQSGCGDLEGTLENNWHWCGRRGEIRFSNPTGKERRIVLDAAFRTGTGAPTTLLIDSPLLTEQLSVTGQPVMLSRTLKIPPGSSVLKLRCDTALIDAPGDERELAFQVINFHLRDAE